MGGEGGDGRVVSALSVDVDRHTPYRSRSPGLLSKSLSRRLNHRHDPWLRGVGRGDPIPRVLSLNAGWARPSRPLSYSQSAAIRSSECGRVSKLAKLKNDPSEALRRPYELAESSDVIKWTFKDSRSDQMRKFDMICFRLEESELAKMFPAGPESPPIMMPVTDGPTAR
eukprot:750689-Hanusia_phi.AAC.5